jgi:hypothetical protein
MLTHTLDQRTAGRSPLLVLADPLDHRRRTACSDLLSVDQPRSALVFAYHRRPREVVDGLDDPRGATIIDLGEDSDADGGAGFGPEVTVERCGAADLTGVGVAVTRAIERHTEGRLHVCLGSLTTLLQYVDRETAFKFLHVTLSRLDSADAVAHGHLDPVAVDAETVATLSSLFDSVLERDDDGWAVQSA